jgi:hypothetical protein
VESDDKECLTMLLLCHCLCYHSKWYSKPKPLNLQGYCASIGKVDQDDEGKLKVGTTHMSWRTITSLKLGVTCSSSNAL